MLQRRFTAFITSVIVLTMEAVSTSETSVNCYEATSAKSQKTVTTYMLAD
jgi:hypothetical protein